MTQFARSSAAALTAATTLLATAAHADIVGSWQESTAGIIEFEYEVTGLPDFDQVRTGLPNCGRAYCVPTSTLDLLAYAANHGFPEVMPGPGAWMTPAKYNEVTGALAVLGSMMLTDPSSGTTKGWQYAALAGSPFLEGEPALPPSKFTVTQMFVNGDLNVRMYKAVKSAIWQNGLLSLSHGWYQTLTCDPQEPSYRDGGHCLAVSQVKGHLHVDGGSSFQDYGASVRLHDPAYDEGYSENGTCDAVAPTSQSVSADNVYTLFLKKLYALIHCFPIGSLDRLWACSSSNCTDPTFRLVDSYLIIATKSAYAFSDDPDPTLFTLKPIQFTSGNLQPVVKTMGTSVPVASASIAPDGDEVLVIANGFVARFDPLAAVPIPTPIPAGDYHLVDPTCVAVGQGRGVFVLDMGAIHRLTLDADVPIALNSVTPAIPTQRVVIDDANHQVIAVSGQAQSIARYNESLNGEPEVIKMPGNVPLDADARVTVDPRSGELWCADGGPTIHRVRAKDGIVIDTTFTIPGVKAAGGFDVDDAGHLLISVNGTLREFAVTGETLNEVVDSPFKGLPGGRIVLVTHSRSNFDPAIHGTPEWRDVFPGSFGDIAPACLGDIDSDGSVGQTDIALVLGAWGSSAPDEPADVDESGLVGPEDLARVLGAWGPCPAPPEPGLILSDECGSAPLVHEGAFQFDTTFTQSDGPGLPKSCDEGFGLGFGADLWALYVPSETGTATISTCGNATYDSRLAVYAGTCTNLALLACNDDSCSVQSSVSLPVIAGVPLLIRLGGFNGATGSGVLNVSLGP
jgi:hypothetical protein